MRTPFSLRLGLLSAVACAEVLAAYRVTAIPVIPGATADTIAGMNQRGQVAGYFRNASGALANFLYTPGIGITNIERTGSRAATSFEGSVVTAINASGQILLSSGLIFSP